MNQAAAIEEVLTTLAVDIRTSFEARNRAREETLALSREVIRTAANSIRAAHRGEFEGARQMLDPAGQRVGALRARLERFPDIYGAGYVHDCQKEFAEASIFLAIVSDRPVPGPDELHVEYAAYLNGLGEAVGELRRHLLDGLRGGELDRCEMLLAVMDEIYHLLVTIDYPDALTGGLRRTTDSIRGIIEKTRGELTVAIRQEELRLALGSAIALARPVEDAHG